MVRWWHEGDELALERLVALGALYSGTRDLKNVVAAYGEYLVCRALDGERLPQPGHRGDCRPPKGRVVEVKTTSSPSVGWNLGRYELANRDYAVVRLRESDWRVLEAWLVPLPLARRYAAGYQHRLARRGEWKLRAAPLRLHRF